MNPILQRVEKELDHLRSIERFRTVKETPPTSLINLSSNSYLNLEKSQVVQQRAQELLQSHAGNGASRLVQSSSPLFAQLETQIAQWKKCDRALLFNSGYAANTGILQALGRKGSEIFSDRLNHASIVDGIKLSGAKMVRYNHCDMDDLQKRLEKSEATEKIIVTDAIFSMDGNRAPLEEIVALGKQFDALIMVDEAHSTGLFGEKGAGLVDELGLSDDVQIKMGTLSKAICGTGGFFAGSELLYNYLVNSARSFIFSTALSEANIAWNVAAIEYIQLQDEERIAFKKRIKAFTESLTTAQIPCGESCSPIIPVFTGSDSKALGLAEFLKAKGFLAPAIRPPTVPQGTSRVRLTIHAGIPEEQLQQLLSALKEFFHG